LDRGNTSAWKILSQFQQSVSFHRSTTGGGDRIIEESLASASGRGSGGAGGWLSRPNSLENLNIALRAQVGLRRDLGVAVCWFCGT